jgi:hypothetical protein
MFDQRRQSVLGVVTCAPARSITSESHVWTGHINAISHVKIYSYRPSISHISTRYIDGVSHVKFSTH